MVVAFLVVMGSPAALGGGTNTSNSSDDSAVMPHPPEHPRQLSDVGPMTELKATLLKHVAHCALERSKFLSARRPSAPRGGKNKTDAAKTAPLVEFHGLLGLAPEWGSRTCTGDCRERVSSCLISLVNRAGKHVEISMTSAAPSMLALLTPNVHDRKYPHQEGAFFGNVWTDQMFACQGTGVRKAPQSKRFCAAKPATCSARGAPIVDVGACARACEMRCFPIGVSLQRCAAVSCRDPSGRVWRHPITVHLKNEIAASTADRVSGMDVYGDGLVPWAARASATFDRVDMGATPGEVTRMRLELLGADPGAQIEAWLGNSRRLGAAVVKTDGRIASLVEIPLAAAELAGPHRIVLWVDGKEAGKIASIEFQDAGKIAGIESP